MGKSQQNSSVTLREKTFLDKTIKKISLENGKFVTTQNEILDYVKLYYQNLFKSRDSSLTDADLNRLLKNIFQLIN